MRRVLMIALALALAFVSCQSEQPARTVEDFNFDWCFTLGDDPSFATEEYDDGEWR